MDFPLGSKKRINQGVIDAFEKYGFFYGGDFVSRKDPMHFQPLIVDTGNGKLCYKLSGAVPNFTLDAPASYYEFTDLFGDDKNPRGMDIMKFQMFGWTLVAIVIYAWLFLSELHDHIETLPRVDASIVILTGLSQAGYLTGKPVANVNRS